MLPQSQSCRRRARIVAFCLPDFAAPAKGPMVGCERLRRDGFANPYRLRKRTVEPVFGQIKQAGGFRQFLMRGLNKVAAEWAMLCTVHNMRGHKDR